MEILKPYKDKWVALTPDFLQVSASGDSLEETRSKLDEKAKSESFFMRVVALDTAYEPAAV